MQVFRIIGLCLLCLSMVAMACGAPNEGCKSAGDCAAGQLCKEGACVTSISLCQKDEDCDKTQRCNQGRCKARSPGCNSDGDCKAAAAPICDAGSCRGCTSAQECKSKDAQTPLCQAGACVAESGCAAGETDCAGTCKNLQKDPVHCGACNKACPSGEICDAGGCSATCEAPKRICQRQCVDPMTDTSHCGACDTACQSAERCEQGTCKQQQASCTPEQTSCAGVCVDTMKDASHCGKCDNACPTGKVCSTGQCTCRIGTTECAGSCTDIATNKDHCGACEKPCASGEICEGGQCKLDCPTGQIACGKKCVDPQKDNEHCGTCATSCETSAGGTFVYASHAGGTGVEAMMTMALDSQGNRYVAGLFTSKFTLGPTTIGATLSAGVFLGKQDNTGKWLWVQDMGASGTDIDDLAVDSQGQIIIVGTFTKAITLGGTALTPTSQRDVFVARLDTTGKWQWVKQVGGTETNEVTRVGIDGAGNAYITGYFQGTAIFGTTTLTSAGSSDTFVAKLDTTGKWLWAKRGGGTIVALGRSLAVTQTGDVYIGGQFGSPSRGSVTFGSTTLNVKDGQDFFIARLDTNGNWQWAKSFGAKDNDVVYDLTVDTKGNIYVTGHIGGPLTLGSHVLKHNRSSDVFVAKMDAQGTWVWAQSTGSTGGDHGWRVKVDDTGHVYLAGSFVGTIQFGKVRLTSLGRSDGFVARLDPLGNWQWARQLGGTLNDSIRGLAIDAKRLVYICGSFKETVKLDSLTMIAVLNGDTYIATLVGAGSQSCSAGLCCDQGTTNCAGSCVSTDSNPDHCGQCANACNANQTCASGTCQ